MGAGLVSGRGTARASQSLAWWDRPQTAVDGESRAVSQTPGAFGDVEDQATVAPLPCLQRRIRKGLPTQPVQGLNGVDCGERRCRPFRRASSR